MKNLKICLASLLLVAMLVAVGCDDSSSGASGSNTAPNSKQAGKESR